MECIYINHISEINEAAVKFLRIIGGHKKIAFYGDMGAGKTSFIKAICNALDVTDLVSSPTFSIINQYNSRSGQVIFHFDFYRIKRTEEIYDLGFEEYYFSGSYCFIEWPGKGEPLYGDDILKVYITETGEEKREVKIEI